MTHTVALIRPKIRRKIHGVELQQTLHEYDIKQILKCASRPIALAMTPNWVYFHTLTF